MVKISTKFELRGGVWIEETLFLCSTSQTLAHLYKNEKDIFKMYFCLFQDFQEKIVQEKPILSDQSDLTDLGMEPDLRLPKVIWTWN